MTLALPNVRFWPIADIPSCPAHIRFTPKSGHVRCVVTSHAATEERNTPYTYVQFTNLLDRLSLVVINFLGQKAWIFLKDGSVFLVAVAMAHWKFCHLWC
jgi:hypothetical protein